MITTVVMYHGKPIAWLPGFDDLDSARRHVDKRAFKNVFSGCEVTFLRGEWFGPLRARYDHVLWAEYPEYVEEFREWKRVLDDAYFRGVPFDFNGLLEQ